jgi:DinB superfamily
MGARAEQLAGKFDQACKDFATVVEKLNDAEWKKQTADEKWPVGVVTHHVAGGCAAIAGIAQKVAKGEPLPGLTMDMIHENNAKHATEFADVTKAEAVDLFKKNAANASSLVRGLSDAELDRSATLLGGRSMTAAQVIEGILINHLNEHLGSIRATVGPK